MSKTSKINKKLQKKSQAEVFGILIVVVLLSLAMFLIAQFVVNKGASTEKQEFSREQAVTNLLSAMLKTTTDCKHLSVTELYQDCANNPEIGGSVTCKISTKSMKSCAYVNITVDSILAESFNSSNLDMHYLYTVVKGEDEIIDGLPDLSDSQYTSKCKNNIISKPNPIPLSPGYLTIELSVC